jgi:hypothetical protein
MRRTREQPARFNSIILIMHVVQVRFRVTTTLYFLTHIGRPFKPGEREMGDGVLADIALTGVMNRSWEEVHPLIRKRMREVQYVSFAVDSYDFEEKIINRFNCKHYLSCSAEIT